MKNGDYEELVYFRNKRFVTIQGESMDGVVVHYPNNEVFNPHPVDIKTNELKGTFPSRRAAVAADNCADMISRISHSRQIARDRQKDSCSTEKETLQRMYMS